MKRKLGVVKGPKIRYFNHRLGAVNAKKPFLRTVGMPVMATVFLMAGGFFGFAQYENLRADSTVRANQPTVANVPEQLEKQPAVSDEKPKQAREDKDLAKGIKKKVDSMPRNTKWAISVRDLSSERMANINADEHVEAGHLGTMFLLSALERKQSPDRWEYRMNTRTYQDCVINMIRNSDTICSDALGGRIGWNNIDSVNRGLGFGNTTVRGDGKHRTTAREVSDLLYRLQNSQILEDKARRVVFDGLYAQQHKDGVPKACGTDCLVAHKTAEHGELKHDAAIVTAKDRKYIIVILSSGTSWAQVADVAASIHDDMQQP